MSRSKRNHWATPPSWFVRYCNVQRRRKEKHTLIRALKKGAEDAIVLSFRRHAKFDWW